MRKTVEAPVAKIGRRLIAQRGPLPFTLLETYRKAAVIAADQIMKRANELIANQVLQARPSKNETRLNEVDVYKSIESIPLGLGLISKLVKLTKSHSQRDFIALHEGRPTDQEVIADAQAQEYERDRAAKWREEYGRHRLLGKSAQESDALALDHVAYKRAADVVKGAHARCAAIRDRFTEARAAIAELAEYTGDVDGGLLWSVAQTQGPMQKAVSDTVVSLEDLRKTGWTDAARAAALEARREHAKGPAEKARFPREGVTKELPPIELGEREKSFLDEVSKMPQVQEQRAKLKSTVPTDFNAPGRSKYHDAFYQEVFKGKRPAPEGTKPELTILLGGPGTGKTGILRPTITKANPHAVVLDADHAKSFLPEHNQGASAGTLHPESGHMIDTAFEKAVDGNYSLVIDRTGRSVGPTEQLVRNAKSAGYQIRVAHITVDPVEAAKRALGRAFLPGHEGRYVDPEYIVGSVGNRADQSYKAVKKTGHLKSWISFDNNGLPGSKPKLLDKGGDWKGYEWQ